MQVLPLRIPDVLLIKPKRFLDDRGSFMESYNRAHFEEAAGRSVEFVQDNHSVSRAGVLRGLHYQLAPMAQAKLIRVTRGEIFDVAVDIRRHSPTFGQWLGATLSADTGEQLWIPEGFAHGFVALTDNTEVLYKASNYYSPQHERSIVWNDRSIGVNWPLDREPLLSPKDAAAPALDGAETFE